jgi:aromatic ring-opening dioxygenase catalytic subunit (LigB family)
MPVLFVGHGSLMNAIEDNKFTDLGKIFPQKFQNLQQ